MDLKKLKDYLLHKFSDARSCSGGKEISMRCLECGSCKYVNGAGVDKGGYCRF